MIDTSAVKWEQRIAVSALHKMLRAGNEEVAAFAAAYLMRSHYGRLAAWRRILAFPTEDMSGEGVEIAAANFLAWKDGYAAEAVYDTISQLCAIVQARGGQLNRAADELKCAAIHWVTGGRPPLPIQVNWRAVEPMATMLYVAPYDGLATVIYQALLAGDIEAAAQVAAYLFFLTGSGKDKDAKATLAAWRPVLHFPYTELGGEGSAFVSACYTCYTHGYEHDNWYAAAMRLCANVQLRGQENPLATLRQRAEARVEDPALYPPVPPEALDMHTGHGTLADFWTYANALGPASPWREDAVAMRWPIPARYKVNAQSQTTGGGGQMPLQGILLRDK